MHALGSYSLMAALEELAKAVRSLQALRRRQSRQTNRDNHLGLSDLKLRVVVATYMLSSYDLDLAERVGTMLVKQAGCSARQQQAQNTIPVRDWYLELPMATLERVFVPVSNVDYSLLQEAAKLMSEVRAARWVRDENFGRGVAPPAYAVAGKYAELVASAGHGPSIDACMQSAGIGSRDGGRFLREWAEGFRDRWGIANNYLASLDAPTVGELGTKAGNF